MIIIFITLLLGLLAYFFNKRIRKFYPVLLGLSIIVSVLSFFTDIEFFGTIIDGFLGLGFLLIVMFAGALKKNSKVSKRLKSVRKEYSIFGVILLLPHGLIYILEFINGTFATEWFGIVALAIMIPLFAISFTTIRKKWITKLGKISKSLLIQLIC